MKSSTDKLSPWKIPFKNLIISVVIDSSRLFMVRIVCHRFVRVSIAFTTFWGTLASFSAWMSQLWGTETKAFLYSNQTVIKFRWCFLASLRIDLLMRSCSVVPHTLCFPPACSGWWCYSIISDCSGKNLCNLCIIYT